MIVHRVEQNTEAWRKLRLGKVTTSNLHRIITPTGRPSQQARDYMCRLIAERLLNEPMGYSTGNSEWASRGLELEEEAASAFTFHTGMELEPGGFVTTDDGTVGCSPDRIIVGTHEAVEIKCPAPWTLVRQLLYGLDDDYRPQVQGQLLVGGFESVHLWAYHPSCPRVHIVTHPDKAYQRVMVGLVNDFLTTLDQETERAKQLGHWIVTEEDENRWQ
jgi:hypothetical protein